MEEGLEIELTQVRPKVLALARKFFRASGLDADPEDVAQDVLLRLWEARRDGAPIRSAEAWSVATTRNCCVSLWRKSRAVKLAQMPESLPAQDDASQRLVLSEAELSARRALERFSAGTRRLLELRATGLSLDELSALTGRSKGSIKSSISQARKEMIKAMNEEV